eukprot:scaffold6067_cov112-Isochrysis_galbana.AAC.2
MSSPPHPAESAKSARVPRVPTPRSEPSGTAALAACMMKVPMAFHSSTASTKSAAPGRMWTPMLAQPSAGSATKSARYVVARRDTASHSPPRTKCAKRSSSREEAMMHLGREEQPLLRRCRKRQRPQQREGQEKDEGQANDEEDEEQLDEPHRPRPGHRRGGGQQPGDGHDRPAVPGVVGPNELPSQANDLQGERIDSARKGEESAAHQRRQQNQPPEPPRQRHVMSAEEPREAVVAQRFVRAAPHLTPRRQSTRPGPPTHPSARPHRANLGSLNWGERVDAAGPGPRPGAVAVTGVIATVGSHVGHGPRDSLHPHEER